MADNKFMHDNGCKEAVCVDAGRVYDSCSEEQCARYIQIFSRQKTERISHYLRVSSNSKRVGAHPFSL